MQDIQKQDFTLRITQANRSRLTVIVFEMAMAYIAEAQEKELENAGQLAEYCNCINQARNCVDELKHSLDYRYSLAGNLAELYIFTNKLLVRAQLGQKKTHLSEAYHILQRLHDSFAEIAEKDTSEPLLENAQTVYAGFTYGKNDINVNTDTEHSKRGFLA